MKIYLFEQKYVYGIYVNPESYSRREEILSVDKILKNILESGLKTTVYYTLNENGYALFESRMWPTDKSMYDILGKSTLKHLIKRGHSYGLNSWVHVNPFKVPARSVENFIKYLARDKDNEVLRESIGGKVNYLLSPAHDEVDEIIFKIVSEILDDCEADGIVLENMFMEIEDFSEKAYTSFIKFLEEKYAISAIAWPNNVLEGKRFRKYYLEWVNNRIIKVIEYLRKSLKERFGYIPLANFTPKTSKVCGSEQFIEYSVMGRLFDYILLNLVNVEDLKNINICTRKVYNACKEAGPLVVSVIGYNRKSILREYFWDNAVKEALSGGSNGIIVYDSKSVSEDNAWNKLKTLIL